MVMQFSDKLIEELIAPGASKLLNPEIPDMSGIEPHWISNFFLNSALRGKYLPKGNAHIYTFLRNVVAALDAYNQARSETLGYAKKNLERRGSQSPAQYGRALSQWENFLAHTWNGLKNIQAMGDPNARFFEDGDGSPTQRMHAIHVSLKHAYERIEKGRMTLNATTPVQIDNAGLVSSDATLSFAEADEILKDLILLADALQDPISAKENLATFNDETS